MRHLHVHVRPERAQRVVELGAEFGAFSPVISQVRRDTGEQRSMVFLSLPNQRVGEFVQRVEEEMEEAEFVLFPQGVLPIRLPTSDVRAQVRQVGARSTLELVLSSLQSVGSWRGLLLYAAFSGVVAAYAVIHNTSYLLVAAMLIAPMGAPGMVCVVGTAIGDWAMFRRGAVRFWTAELILSSAAVALGLAYGLSYSTATMEQVSSLSTWSVLLALVGGAAGAQAQIQSDRDSLVTATATGFLVAVALSPPSAVLGLAVGIGRWDYVGQMAFILVLTWLGIVAGGWLMLRSFGVTPAATALRSGRSRARAALAAGATLGVLGMVAWQTAQSPRFRKADLSRRAVEMTRQALRDVPDVRLIETSAHFTRPDLRRPEEALLVDVVVSRPPGAPDGEQVERLVREAVERRVRAAMPGVVPVVSIRVLPALFPDWRGDEP